MADIVAADPSALAFFFPAPHTHTPLPSPSLARRAAVDHGYSRPAHGLWVCAREPRACTTSSGARRAHRQLANSHGKEGLVLF